MRRARILTELPTEVREALDGEIIARHFSGYKEIGRWLAERGYRIGVTAVQVYGRRLQLDLKAIKLVTQEARAIAAASPDDEAALSDAVIRLVQTKIFRLLRDMDELELKRPGLNTLSKLTSAIASVSRAAVEQKKWGIEDRAQMRARLETAIVEGLKSGGLSAAMARKIRAALRGDETAEPATLDAARRSNHAELE